MSYKVYFDMSTGLSKPVTVPKGTLAKILERVHFTENELGYEIEESPNGHRYWRDKKPKDGISDEVFCQVASKHNSFVIALYEELERYSEMPAVDGETLTIEQSEGYWYGLVTIHVPIEKWTEDYYRERMDELYETMRGRGEAVTFDSKPLTPRQAADVMNIFSQYLDKWDLRLDVPKGHDYLASSNDGGYYWCEKCGAVTEEDAANCTKRKCPIKAEWGEEEESV